MNEGVLFLEALGGAFLAMCAVVSAYALIALAIKAFGGRRK